MEIYQNVIGAPIRYYGQAIEPDFIYGRVNGVVFYTAPMIDVQTRYMPLVVRDNQHIHKWEKRCIPAIVNAIVEERFHGKEVQFLIKAKRGESYAQRKREILAKYRRTERDLRASAMNTTGAVRVFHTRASRSKNVAVSPQYMNASRMLYGWSLDMNGKTMPVNGKVSEYMDGNTGIGYRPYEPQFPMKSHKAM